MSSSLTSLDIVNLGSSDPSTSSQSPLSPKATGQIRKLRPATAYPLINRILQDNMQQQEEDDEDEYDLITDMESICMQQHIQEELPEDTEAIIIMDQQPQQQKQKQQQAPVQAKPPQPQLSAAQRLLRSQHALQEIVKYLQVGEMLQLQLVGRKFYDCTIPKVMRDLQHYPDILMNKQSYFDRAKELFTEEFTMAKARLFYKIIQRQESRDYMFYQWQPYESQEQLKVERDYERARRKTFVKQYFEASEYLEYHGEVCSGKLVYPQGIGKMTFRSGEIQEGWFDMGSLRQLRRTRMGDTNRFARSIYTFDDPVRASMEEMRDSFSILLDKDENLIIQNGPSKGQRITIKKNGQVTIK